MELWNYGIVETANGEWGNGNDWEVDCYTSLLLRRFDERVVDAALRGIVVDANVEDRRRAVKPWARILLRAGLR